MHTIRDKGFLMEKGLFVFAQTQVARQARALARIGPRSMLARKGGEDALTLVCLREVEME